uniref:G-protein coupled receptors family 3 profile domain-containing protein n=1 Tax=Graphocephala atropunctata TaxID=36148 RepID=A0A1B6LP65_9HEMI
MAWETRHVKIPALNDSQYIGLSVYSVVITSALVVVLANLISERATLAFVTITALILTSTTTSLCLLFLPKIHAILHNRDSTADPVTYSMGLKIECNTRRFLIDDRREVYYRVEVQNRVYRREISVLDNEISKLEKVLASDQSVASSSHSSVVSRKATSTVFPSAAKSQPRPPKQPSSHRRLSISSLGSFKLCQ